MIRNLKNKVVVGAVMLGAVGATLLAGAGTGVANADEMRDGRGNDRNRVVVVDRDGDARADRYRDVRFDGNRDNRRIDNVRIVRDGCR